MTNSIKAIVIGWLISYLGQWLINKPVLIIFALLGMNGSSDTAKYQQVMEALRTSVPLHIIQLISQSVFTIVGAYVAVQIVKRAPMKHSLVLGILVLVTTTLFALDTLRVWPLWYSISSLALAIPTACLGGYLAARKIQNSKAILNDAPPIPEP